jgi:hypothetical protein
MLNSIVVKTEDVVSYEDFQDFAFDLKMDWNDEVLSSPSSEAYSFGCGTSTDSVSSDRFDESDSISAWGIVSHQSTKKQRVRDRRRVFIPKVVKHDIRRYYSQMLANAMNSVDATFMESFLQSYSVPTIRMKKEQDVKQCTQACADPRFGASEKNPPHDFRVDLQGSDSIAQFWTLVFASHPDTAVRINETKIISRINTTSSTLVSDFQVEFTKTRHTEFMMAVADFLHASKENASSGASGTIGKRQREEESKVLLSAAVLKQLYDATVKYATPLAQPLPIKVYGKVTMELDEEKRIEYMTFGPVVMAF